MAAGPALRDPIASHASLHLRYRSPLNIGLPAGGHPPPTSTRVDLFAPVVALPSPPQSPWTPFPQAQTQSHPLRDVERSYLAHDPLPRPSTTPVAPCPSLSCTYSPSSGPPPRPAMSFFPLSRSQPCFYSRRRPPTRHARPLVTPTASQRYSIKPVLPASLFSHLSYHSHRFTTFLHLTIFLHLTTFLHFTITHRLITSSPLHHFPPCRAGEFTSAIPPTTPSSRTTPSRSAGLPSGAMRPTAVRPTAVRPFRY